MLCVEAAGAIGPRNDCEQMAVRIVKIDAPAIIPSIDSVMSASYGMSVHRRI